jgi:hypothetical protein
VTRTRTLGPAVPRLPAPVGQAVPAPGVEAPVEPVGVPDDGRTALPQHGGSRDDVVAVAERRP